MRPTRPVPKSAMVPGSGFEARSPVPGPPPVGLPPPGPPPTPPPGSPPPAPGSDGGVSSSPSPPPGDAGSLDPPLPADGPLEPPPADGLGPRDGPFGAGAGLAGFGFVDSLTLSLRAPVLTAVSAVVPLCPNGLIVCQRPPS